MGIRVIYAILAFIFSEKAHMSYVYLKGFAVATMIMVTVWFQVLPSHQRPPLIRDFPVESLIDTIPNVTANDGLPVCPMPPTRFHFRTEVRENVTESEVSLSQPIVRVGGSWWPPNCTAGWRVAIIVPYRDRERMVAPFLNQIHPFLQRQLLNYSIYIVEQTPKNEFNKGILLNAGYELARDDGPWDCYVFQDIDCIPEDDRNLYYCGSQPRHLAVAVSKFNYRLFYPTCFGGASVMSGAQVEQVNGWSNLYFGWGGEDDDMWERITAEGMEVKRYPAHIATYTMLQHAQHTINPVRHSLLAETRSRYKADGLNNLNYSLLSISRRHLYTKFLIDV